MAVNSQDGLQLITVSLYSCFCLVFFHIESGLVYVTNRHDRSIISKARRPKTLQFLLWFFWTAHSRENHGGVRIFKQSHSNNQHQYASFITELHKSGSFSSSETLKCLQSPLQWLHVTSGEIPEPNVLSQVTFKFLTPEKLWKRSSHYSWLYGLETLILGRSVTKH